MIFKTLEVECEKEILDYTVTPAGDVMLQLSSSDSHKPEYVILNLPEVGGIFLKYLAHMSKR